MHDISLFLGECPKAMMGSMRDYDMKKRPGAMLQVSFFDFGPFRTAGKAQAASAGTTFWQKFARNSATW